MSYITNELKFREAIREVLEVKFALLQNTKLFLGQKSEYVYNLCQEDFEKNTEAVRELVAFVKESNRPQREKMGQCLKTELMEGVNLPSIRIEVLYAMSSLSPAEILTLQEKLKKATANVVDSVNMKKLAYRIQREYMADQVEISDTNVFCAIHEMLQRLGRYDGALQYLISWLKAQGNEEFQNSVQLVQFQVDKPNRSSLSEDDTEGSRRVYQIDAVESMDALFDSEDGVALKERLGEECAGLTRMEDAQGSLLIIAALRESLRESLVSKVKQSASPELDYIAKLDYTISQEEKYTQHPDISSTGRIFEALNNCEIALKQSFPDMALASVQICIAEEEMKKLKRTDPKFEDLDTYLCAVKGALSEERPVKGLECVQNAQSIIRSMSRSTLEKVKEMDAVAEEAHRAFENADYDGVSTQYDHMLDLVSEILSKTKLPGSVREALAESTLLALDGSRPIKMSASRR